MTEETPELVRHEVAFQGYLKVIRYFFRHALHNGGTSGVIRREVLERGHAGAVPIQNVLLTPGICSAMLCAA